MHQQHLFLLRMHIQICTVSFLFLMLLVIERYILFLMYTYGAAFCLILQANIIMETAHYKYQQSAAIRLDLTCK